MFRTVHPPRVTALEFGVLRAEDIRKRSVVEVSESTLYAKGVPKANGLNDTRMGTTDRRIRCGTCKHTIDRCNGHTGHIELAAPVYHVGHLETVLKILRVTCYWCSALVIVAKPAKMTKAERAEGNETKFTPNPHLCDIIKRTLDQARFNAVTKLAPSNKKHQCYKCQGYNPQYSDGPVNINVDWSHVEDLVDPEDDEALQRPFTPAEAYSILTGISDQEATVLGFDPAKCHPRDFIQTVLCVAPPIIRPVITMTDMSRSKGQDDLTRKYQEILKYNTTLRNEMAKAGLETMEAVTEEAFNTKLQNAYGALQYCVATMFRDDIKGLKASKQRSGAPTRSLTKRIKGKTGRVRANLMGKRTDQSARSVISPDPFIDIDEVGVPLEIALSVSVTVRVTHRNVAELTERVILGPGRLDGATTVINEDGGIVNLRMAKEDMRRALRLKVGWFVERPLNNGDVVLMNRQPTLHRASIMAHKARVMLGRTMRLNPSDTTPYNADYDGDEMNLHVPQSEGARAEARELMSVKEQMLNAQYNKPTIGLVQDGVSGSYYMTRKDVFIDREQAMNLAMTIHYPDCKTIWSLPEPAILRPKPLWTGKQIYSMAMPRKLSLNRLVRDAFDEDYEGDSLERCVVIRHGQLLHGALCKQTLGTSSGGIVHVICKECGNQRAVEFLSDAQRLVMEWLATFGLSVGLRDCMTDESTEQRVRGVIERTLQKVEYLRELSSDGTVTTTPDALEAESSSIMCQLIETAGRVVQTNMTDHNRIHALATSGAKGSRINISQIMATVGQQSVTGRRIGATPVSFDDPRTPAERGLVANSYKIGLEPREFFHHAMAGREGLVDTAVKTSDTGYIQHRLTKAMESFRVHPGGTVRNAENKIVQMQYGGDGLDAQFLEKHSLTFITFGDDELRRRVVWDEPTSTKEFETLLDLRRQCRNAKMTLLSPELSTTVYVPVNPTRAFEALATSKRSSSEPVTPDRAHAIVSEFCDWLYESFEARGASSLYLRALMRYTFRTKALCASGNGGHHGGEGSGGNVTASALGACMTRLKDAIERYRVAPGEMVGILAAESIGEPATQMTLNSVVYSTELAVHDGDKVTSLRIGSWIDRLLQIHSGRVQHIPENRTELLDLTVGAARRCTIPSVDAEGNIRWKRVTAVTRHLPVGKLLYITTASGRHVTATRQKSFLRFNPETKRVEETEGTSLRVGDLLPVQHAAPLAASRKSSVTGLTDADTDRDFMHGYVLAMVEFATGVYYDDTNLTLEISKVGSMVRVWDYHVTMLRKWAAVYGGVNRETDETLQVYVDSVYAVESLGSTTRALLSGSPMITLGALSLVDKIASSKHGVVLKSHSANVLSWIASTMHVYVTVQWNPTRTLAACCIVKSPEEHGYTVHADIILDPILSIAEVDIEDTSSQYVYDLTVEDTLNFNLLNGLCMRDTFHFTGVASKNVTLGVPRLKEIVDYTKNIQTPSLTVVPLKTYAEFPENLTSLCHSLERVCISSVVLEDSVVHDPDPMVTEQAEDREVVRLGNLFVDYKTMSHRPSQFVIRYVLNKTKMRKRNLTPYCVAEAVRDYLGNEAVVMYSETAMPLWVIRVRLVNARVMAERLDGAPWKAERTINYNVLGKILENVYLGGVEGITRASVRHVRTTVVHEETQTCTVYDQPVIDTAGSNLIHAWMAEGVDWTRTTTNDIDETVKVLGIEAALALLYNELKTVLSFDGSYVNARHILMVTNTMGFRGSIVAMTRFGINRVDVSVCAKASFEETMDVFLNAASFSMCDPMRGVSENIMTGGRVPMGTGTVHLMLDEQYKSSIMDSSAKPSKPMVYRSMITEWGALHEGEVEPPTCDEPPVPSFTPMFEPPPAVLMDPSLYFPDTVEPPPPIFAGLPSACGILPPADFSASASAGVSDLEISPDYRPSSPTNYVPEETARPDYRPSSPSAHPLDALLEDTSGDESDGDLSAPHDDVVIGFDMGEIPRESGTVDDVSTLPILPVTSPL